MRSVYEPSSAIQAHLLQDVLRQHGIASHVQGAHLQGAVGELPAGNLVRLLVNDDDYAAARRAVEDWEHATPMDEDELAHLDRSATATAAIAATAASTVSNVQALPPAVPGSHSSYIAGLLVVMAIGLLAWFFL